MSVEQLSIELKNKRICRFCMTQNEPLTNIYSRENRLKNSAPLPLQVMACVSIEVFTNDGMPSTICNQCRRFMDFCYRYKQMCKKSDNSLRQYPLTGIWPNKLQIPKLSEELIDEMYPNLKKQNISTPKEQKQLHITLNPTSSITSNLTPKLQTSFIGSGKSTIINLTQQQKQKFQHHHQSYPARPRLLNKNSVKILNKDAQKNSEPILSHPVVKKNSSGNIEVVTEIINQRTEEVDPIKNATPVVTNVYPCSLCERSFPLRQLLEIHLMNHNRERGFQCDICLKSFFSKYDLNKHILIHTGEKPFKCIICNKAFTRSTLLHRHQKVHVDQPKLLCVYCEKPFLSQEELDHHTQRHKKNRPFVCKICNKAFAFKQGLERHETVHAKNQPYPCQYCEFSFSTPSKLARHLTAHAGKRPFPCKLCPKSYLLSHHLTRHLRSHKQGEGSYKCYECAKIFVDRDSLIYHSAMHATQTLVCPICKDVFENLDLVTEHIRNHAVGEQYACEFCDLIFMTPTKLHSHCGSEHAEDLAAYEEHDKNNEKSDTLHNTTDDSLESTNIEEVIEEFIIDDYQNNDGEQHKNASHTISFDDNLIKKEYKKSTSFSDENNYVSLDIECIEKNDEDDYVTSTETDDEYKTEDFKLEPNTNKRSFLNSLEQTKVIRASEQCVQNLKEKLMKLKSMMDKKPQHESTKNLSTSLKQLPSTVTVIKKENISVSSDKSPINEPASSKQSPEDADKVKTSTQQKQNKRIVIKSEKQPMKRSYSDLNDDDNIKIKKLKSDDKNLVEILIGDRKVKVQKIMLKKSKLSPPLPSKGSHNKLITIKQTNKKNELQVSPNNEGDSKIIINKVVTRSRLQQSVKQ